ncbi:MAG: hypothetical protein ACRCU1_13910, partial [Alsobacter sp.]
LDRTWPMLFPAFRRFGPRDSREIGRNHRRLIAAARRGDADEAVATALAAVDANRAHIIGKIRAGKAEADPE